MKRRSTLEEVAEAAVAGALSRGGGGVAGELARRASNDGLMRRLRGARTSTAIIAGVSVMSDLHHTVTCVLIQQEKENDHMCAH